MTNPASPPTPARWHALLEAALHAALERRDGADLIAALAAADHTATARDLLTAHLLPEVSRARLERYPQDAAGWCASLRQAAEQMLRAAEEHGPALGEDLREAAVEAAEAADAFARLPR